MPVQKLNRAIMYRAYPTPEQQVLLSKTFGCVRFVWNHMLMDAQQFWDEAGVFFIPTPAKYKNEFPFLKEIDSGALCNAQLDLKEARKRHREDPKNVGVPTLKSKRKSKMSYTTNVHSYVKKDGQLVKTLELTEDAVHLPKVGFVKIKKHRSPGNGWQLKAATVSCTRSGKYFVSLLYEFEKDIQPIKPTKETSLGLDYSSHDFYVDSNGDVANYPRFYRQSEAKLARAQRRLSRMQFGSHHYDKQLYKVRVLQEHIANQRKNFCHTASTAIAKQYDAVFVEDINLRGLAGSLKLGKSTNDNGFGMFRTMLEYKLTSQGKTFAKTDKWYPSSKTCSVCGFIKNDLTLADRVWTCSACGTTHNRDHNAAINIRNVGLLGLYPA
jgi:putative transposase